MTVMIENVTHSIWNGLIGWNDIFIVARRIFPAEWLGKNV